MSDEQHSEKFEAWGMLELFGHQRLAGRITDQTIGGVHFIRVDVPEVDAQRPAYSRFFPQGAIYGMTPTTEDVARRLAASLRTVPIARYDLPALEAPEPRRSHVPDDDDERF